MEFSVDTYISKQLGVDNHLCAPQRSISFWGLLVILTIDLLQCWRHASGHSLEMSLFAVVPVGAILLFIHYRIRLLSFLPSLRTGDDLSDIRTLSSIALRLTGLVIFSCLLGATFLR